MWYNLKLYLFFVYQKQTFGKRYKNQIKKIKIYLNIYFNCLGNPY